MWDGAATHRLVTELVRRIAAAAPFSCLRIVCRLSTHALASAGHCAFASIALASVRATLASDVSVAFPAFALPCCIDASAARLASSAFPCLGLAFHAAASVRAAEAASDESVAAASACSASATVTCAAAPELELLCTILSEAFESEKLRLWWCA